MFCAARRAGDTQKECVSILSVIFVLFIPTYLSDYGSQYLLSLSPFLFPLLLPCSYPPASSRFPLVSQRSEALPITQTWFGQQLVGLHKKQMTAHQHYVITKMSCFADTPERLLAEQKTDLLAASHVLTKLNI